MPDFTIIEATIPESDNCQILSKTRAFIADQTWSGSLQWNMLDSSGNPIDMTSLYPGGVIDGDLEDDPKVVAAFSELSIHSNKTPVCVDATVLDIETGQVKVKIPAEIAALSGIFTVQWALQDADGGNLLINKTILSLEPSLFAGSKEHRESMTLGQIRAYMQDYTEENLLLAGVEFDDSDITQAIIRPVRQWNETPPNLGRFDTNNFPWIHNWMEATVGYLLTSAAMLYERNDLKISAGGVSVADKAKSATYMRLAEVRLNNWNIFMAQKKQQLNIQAGWGGVVSSSYRQGRR